MGSSKPQRLASSSDTEAVAPAAQLAHLTSTPSAGEPIVDHRAPLMMEDSEAQLWQACPFCVITLRRHHARSPEGYI